MLGLDAPTLIARLVVLLIAFTFHEFSHAFSADLLGDTTPRRYGRLTLNPLRHLDPLGSLLLLTGGFGWAKPVPVNPYALLRTNPAGMMLVSISGPLSNLLLAVLGSIPLKFPAVLALPAPAAFLPSPATFFSIFVWTNLALMLFNLIPLAPLDGDAVLDYFLPEKWSRALDKIRPYGPAILLVIVIGGPLLGIPVLSWIISEPLTRLYILLVG